jgi:hypothetical protein
MTKAVFRPTKSLFLDALTSDLSLIDAISDLVDNSVDAARANLSSGGFNTRWIRIRVAKTIFSIVDNCGGIEASIARDIAFRLGRPKDYKPTPGLVGRFGIGMKRALFLIGENIVVESSTAHSHFKLPISIPEWSKNDLIWDFDFSEFDEGHAKAGAELGTAIYIRELKADTIDQFVSQDFLRTLVETLQKKHKARLQDGLKIEVNEIPLTSKPFKLKRGEYIQPLLANYEFNGAASTVNVKILSGVDESKKEDAGWYVSCNGRFILVADKTPATVWGDGPTSLNPRMHNQYSRFRGYVYFECDDPARLPWNSTKTSINPDSVIYKTVKKYLASATRPVIDYLNKLDAELDQDDRPLTDALEKTTSEPIALLLMDKRKSITFAFKPFRGVSNPDRKVRISYQKKLSQVMKVRDKIKSDDNRDVGEKTFEYFFAKEIKD